MSTAAFASSDRPCAGTKPLLRLVQSAPTPLVARGSELAALDRLLEDVAAGPRALLLEGEPGIGKTMVWRELFERARARSLPVLACRPVEAETKLAFASLADLLNPVADDALPALPEPQRLALEVALLRSIPQSTPPDGRAVATAVVSLLALLAEDSPLVLAIDDVQWLDRASAAALAFALRRLHGLPIGIVAALRVEPAAPGDPLALEEALPLERLRLRPLGLNGLHEVIATQLGHVFPRKTLQRIGAASRGNPLFALELARALVESGAQPGPGDPLPVPETLGALLIKRVAGLPAPAREALLVAASMSKPTTGLVARALGDEAATALAHAEHAAVIEIRNGDVRFSHPLLASAVYSSVSPEERRALHRRLAELADDVEECGRHLALATVERDENIACALDAAAAQARARGAPDAAAELQEQAARLTPADDAPAIRRRTMRAAAHAFHAGDRPHARALLEGVLDQATGDEERADSLRLLAEVRYHDDSFPEAIELFERALEHVEDAPTQLGLAMAFIGAAQFGGAEPHARRAVELAEPLGDGALIAQALAVLELTDLLLGRGLNEDRIRRVLELEELTAGVPLVLRPSMVVATALFYSGHLERARALYHAVRDRLVEQGEESHMPALAAHMAWLECRRGDFAAAAVIADEGLETSVLVGSESMQALLRCVRGLANVYRGDVDAAKDDLDQAAAELKRTGFVMGLALGLSFRGFLEHSLGHHAETHRFLKGVVAPFEVAVSEPLLAWFVPDEAEALIALGEVDRAEDLVTPFESRARERELAWAIGAAGRCRGLIAAARGDLPGALVTLERAIADHERAEPSFELGRTLLVLGQVRRRAGERRAAKDALERARGIFEQLGARLWAERATVEIGRIPIRRRASDELTASEERVAELAGAGLTNRDVATALFVSPKTVEANLSRIYRKLDIGSRAELGARMAERSAASTKP